MKKTTKKNEACRCREPKTHRDCMYCGTGWAGEVICGVCKEAGIDGKLIRGTGRVVCSKHKNEESKKVELVKYTGVVSWYNKHLGKSMVKYVSVMGPVEWDPTYYGEGTEMMEAIEAKARKRWPKARCGEAWRD